MNNLFICLFPTRGATFGKEFFSYYYLSKVEPHMSKNIIQIGAKLREELPNKHMEMHKNALV